MSSLADLPELVGFFSYSREDDADSHGALSALRTRIQGELRGQLGRTAKTFRLWQDKEAIPSGTLWESEIKTAVAQSVFFIPIITPTVVASPHCKFELESFLAREATLGRDDLVFPILYIDVPALEDPIRRQNDPVLSLIAKRQYADWRKFRHRDVRTTDVSEAVERFCTDVRDALQRPWISPEERKQREEAAALGQAEADRQRLEAEAKRRAEEEARRGAMEEERQKREAEAEQRRIEKAEAERRTEEEAQRRREVEAKRKAEAELRQAEERRLRAEVEARRRAEADERRRLRRAQTRLLWPPSRAMLVAGSLIALAVLVAVGIWIASPTPITVSALSPQQERGLKPKDTFQECSKCPVMTVVPAGSFTMGSPASEPGRDGNEGPQHNVTLLRPFAVGKFALTFDEWDACAADGGCNGYRPSDQGWGRGHRPVINVSWADANAYVTWLSRKTGKTYRLLSEAEYEYATRAGTTTAYPWGNDIGRNNANCKGCGSQWDGKQTAAVGSFAPNRFGLYDMVGNVWAWTEDCYHESYNGAPADGSAWISGNCSRRVLRGGSWSLPPPELRSANRYWLTTDERYPHIGFRVGWTLIAP